MLRRYHWRWAELAETAAEEHWDDREDRDTREDVVSDARYSLRGFADSRCTGRKDTRKAVSCSVYMYVDRNITRKYTKTHLVIFLGAELDERRVNLLVDRPTHVRGNRIEKVDTGRTRGSRRE